MSISKVGQAFLPVHRPGKPTSLDSQKCLSYRTRSPHRGAALLAVLWLSAALAAIAFSLANTVRGEVERTSTSVDGLRTYYLAKAGVERGILYMLWGMEGQIPRASPLRYTPATPLLPFAFPGGDAMVELIPETAKLNINTSPPRDLLRLLVGLGVDPGRAEMIVSEIVVWRSRGPAQALSISFPGNSSFRPRPTSFEETEELLLVPGMTPDLFYGGYYRDAEGRLVPLAGLKECVSVFGSTDQFDVNSAQPAVLAVAGVPPEVVAGIVARRRVQPFLNAQEVGGGYPRLRVGGHSIFTIRSTARLRLPNGQYSDLRRTVAATVKFLPGDIGTPVQILRWYDNAWTP